MILRGSESEEVRDGKIHMYIHSIPVQSYFPRCNLLFSSCNIPRLITSSTRLLHFHNMIIYLYKNNKYINENYYNNS